MRWGFCGCVEVELNQRVDRLLELVITFLHVPQSLIEPGELHFEIPYAVASSASVPDVSQMATARIRPTTVRNSPRTFSQPAISPMSPPILPLSTTGLPIDKS